MVICVCIDVVVGNVLAVVVGYCGVKGCYFIALEVLYLGVYCAMVVVELVGL